MARLTVRNKLGIAKRNIESAQNLLAEIYPDMASTLKELATSLNHILIDRAHDATLDRD